MHKRWIWCGDKVLEGSLCYWRWKRGNLIEYILNVCKSPNVSLYFCLLQRLKVTMNERGDSLNSFDLWRCLLFRCKYSLLKAWVPFKYNWWCTCWIAFWWYMFILLQLYAISEISFSLKLSVPEICVTSPIVHSQHCSWPGSIFLSITF